MRLVLAVAVVAVIAAGGLWAMTSSDAPAVRSAAPSPEVGRVPAATPTATPARPLRVRAAHCPAALAECLSVRGRVVYVESVDPDGDGDLHVVVAGSGITAPGLTSVDVARALRPSRDPRLGDQVSAAGEVQRGSFGQPQLHAVEFHVRRARQ